ncbi:M48 family metallopeptidase [Halomicroarcula sp. GCM10025709]|uniref:M48 family metallopeptidase n=1 Tax=Haloarcula TaxID=2237 RepID=UPI0024C3AB73|nr:M48 family metalloprotease [Halomicroarcula sp. YJ-61-S]
MAATSQSTWRVRARLLVLGVVLVAFDAVAVAAAYVLGYLAVGLAPLLWNDFGALFGAGIDTGVLVPVVAVGTPVVLIAQSVFGYRMTLRAGLSDATDPAASSPDSIAAMRRKIDREETVQAVRDRVERLAHTADMATPEVSIVESATPNSFVASRPGERTLFVTTALVERLADDELDAVLAHELAHLKHGDSVVMTAAAFLPTVTDRWQTVAVGVLRRSFLTGWLFAGDDADARTLIAGQFELVLVVFALASLPVVAALSLASTACYRLLSRIREYAADAGAVAICGSPGAMASALETLTTDHRPEQDLRTARTGVRELCVLPDAIEAVDEADEADATSVAGRIGGGWARLRVWLLPGSHPDIDDRIDTLRDRQRAVDDPDESAF